MNINLFSLTSYFDDRTQNADQGTRTVTNEIIMDQSCKSNISLLATFTEYQT